MDEDLDVFFMDGEESELYLLNGESRCIKAIWNFDSDPMFGDRAAGTSVAVAIKTSDARGIVEDSLLIRDNGDRYQIIASDPACGDGALTILTLTHEQS